MFITFEFDFASSIGYFVNSGLFAIVNVCTNTPRKSSGNELIWLYEKSIDTIANMDSASKMFGNCVKLLFLTENVSASSM